MTKLAGSAAVALALLACDASNPVEPVPPPTPGPAPGGGGLVACVGLGQVAESEFFSEASASREFGGTRETLRVTIGLRVEPRGQQGLSSGSPTDQAIIMVAYEPDQPQQAAVSTSLGFFTGPGGLPVRECGLGLLGEPNIEQCAQALGKKPEEARAPCRIARLALRPGNDAGEARIRVEVGRLSVSPDPVTVIERDPRDLGTKDGDGEP